VKARVHPLRAPLAARGPLVVPGDKSISHRALILAALAEGESRIAGLAPGQDVRSTQRCLEQLGVAIEREGDEVRIRGGGLRPPSAPLDCGNSGTTMRMLAGILAGAGIPATLVGDASLSKRPMERVAGPLRKMGARIETGEGGRPPLRILAGAPLHGERIEGLPSAQVKSAVLLAGLFATGETSYTEPARSRDHTERMLRMAGVQVAVRGTTASVRGPLRLSPIEMFVPGDLSSAAFLVALALVAPEGSALSIANVGVNPTRAGFLDAMALFGARLGLSLGGSAQGEPAARIDVGAQKLRGASIDGELTLRAIDEVPILAVLGALAEGETVIRGAEELRVKESDRIARMAAGLRDMGAAVEELPDGLRVGGSRLRGARIDSAHDHRIALAFSVAALRAEGPTEIEGAEWADVSFPGFFDLVRSLGAEVELSA